jgi:hypothetical protein
MAKFMHIWGELNFLALLLGLGLMIPSFDGSFMEPRWLAFSVLPLAAVSWSAHSLLFVLLNRREQ